MITRHVVCPAPAKINLALHVTGKRADGFHDLETLAVFCAIGDCIRISAVAGTAGNGIKLGGCGPFAGDLPDGEDNIVLAAAQAFLKETGQSGQGLCIRLEKNLPLASGMGGGSADAAATLLALEKFAGSPGDIDLINLSQSIGSDVPMCVHSNPLIARGRGEVIEPINDFPQLHLVLVNPGVAVSTPKVFSVLEKKDNPPLTPLPDPQDHHLLMAWLEQQRNDLEAPAIALVPMVDDVLQAIGSSGANLARMSGSGATCFGIFANAEQAADAALQIGKNHPDWWVVATKTQNPGRNRAQEVSALR